MQLSRTTTATAAGLALATMTAGLGIVTASAAPPPDPAPKAPATKSVTVWHGDKVTATVKFANRSAKLRTKATAKLERTAAKVPDDARKVRGDVVGWVQQGGSKKLSERRATNVKKALVSNGVDGTWKTRGKGVDGPTKQSRKATVTIRFQRSVTLVVPLPPAQPGATVTATSTATELVTQTATATTTVAGPTPTATETVTVTPTTTVTATATQTVDETVTATATATVTETVTASPVLAPVNNTAPYIGMDSWSNDVLLSAHPGEWAEGPHTFDTIAIRWEGGTITGWGDSGPECGNFIPLNGFPWTGPAPWDIDIAMSALPECTRAIVTATNSAGSTDAYTEPFVLVV